MKRKTKLFDKMVGPVVVYLEDVERLIEFLCKDGAVTFETEEMTYVVTEGDTLPDDKLYWAKIKTHNVAVVLGSKGAHIFQAEDDDERTWAICARAHDFLSAIRAKQRRGNITVMLGFVAFFFAVQSFASAKPNWVSAIVLLISALSTLIVVIYNVFGSIVTPQASVIILKKRKDAPTFWMKYREDFAKQAVTALISGLIGFGIGRVNAVIPSGPAGHPVGQATTQPTTHP